MDSPIAEWIAPTPDDLGDNIESFLTKMGGPTILHIPGKQRHRCRFVCTLLHSNEPSGTRAIFRWLKQPITPAVDIYCFIASVKNALSEPMFQMRHLANEKDLNRCFKPPFEGPQGQLAKAFLNYLAQKNPEALIDIHNTSGIGPSFSVCMQYDRAHEALTSLFTERMLVTGLKLGALFELSEKNVPTATIECGGAQDPKSDDIAYDGLIKYVSRENVLAPTPSDWPLDVLYEPVRLELSEDAIIRYRDQQDNSADLTLLPDVERYNFGEITPGTLLGWANPKSWDKLKARTICGKDIKDVILKLENHSLYPKIPLKLFMITTNPDIAKSDCVFYAVARDGSHLYRA